MTGAHNPAAAALIKAAKEGDIPTIKKIVDEGSFNINEEYDGDIALIIAADYGQLAAIEFLLDSGADINVRDSKGQNTALCRAATHEKPEAMLLLLQRGADANVVNWRNDTPLILAAKFINDPLAAEIITLMLDRGADVNAAGYGGETALMGAASLNNSYAVKCLLENGADRKAADSQGKTAFDFARRDRRDDIITMLETMPEYPSREDLKHRQEELEQEREKQDARDTRVQQLRKMGARSPRF